MAHLLGKPLPKMAISKIKRDENGNPDRAKYCIVALKNLDHHNWSKSGCFVPVMSSLKLHLLFSIYTQMKRIPKGGDFIQAFCQSFLPPGEKSMSAHLHQVAPSPPRTPTSFFSKLSMASSAVLVTGTTLQLKH